MEIIKNEKPKIIQKGEKVCDCDSQHCYTLKVERSGFIPRSIEIRKMMYQGELNTLMKEYENNKLIGDDSDLEIPIPVANLKGLDRDDLIRAVRDRSYMYNEKIQQELAPLQKRELELQTALDFYNKHKKEQSQEIEKDKE